MENQPETGPASSTHMDALVTLLQQQTERLAQQQADRDARQEERDARREERFAQQLAQLDERLTEQLHFHLNEVREAFAGEVKRIHHELSAPTGETSVPVQTVVRRERYVMQQRPPKYDGKSIWETFRAQFEIVAELNEWTSTEMAAFLATSLEGSAANVIASMESSKRRDYAALVDALETRFGTAVQKELNRVKLRSIRRLKGESLAAVADEVERLARLAYNDAPATTQDNHAKEQFVDAITDDDLRVRVLQTRPGTLQDALRSALELESYTLAVRGTPSVRTIDTSVDTTKQDLPKLVKQLFTEFSGTMATQLNEMVSRRCPEPRTADNRDYQFHGVCWNCSQGGHFARQCPYAMDGRWQQQPRWGSDNRSYLRTDWQPPPQQAAGLQGWRSAVGSKQ